MNSRLVKNRVLAIAAVGKLISFRCLLASALLLICQACLATNIRVAAQIGSEPKFITSDGSGKIIGLCVDIMRAIEIVEPGLKFVGDQQWMPLTRIAAEMAGGLQDAACALQHTSERDKKFLFLEPALYPVDYMLLARIDDPVVINNWSDVRNLVPKPIILVNRGFGVASTLAEMSGIQIDASSSETRLNLEKLLAGRGRLYFHRGPGIPKMLERAGVSKKIKILPTSMLRTEFYLVLSLHVDQATVQRVRRAVQTLHQSGELKRLYDKWNESPRNFELTP